MKKIFSVIAIVVVIVLQSGLLAACEVENYESGDGEYSNMVAEFADTYTTAEKTLTRMMTDEGDSLVFADKYLCDWATTADSVFRALVYYNKVAGGKADVLSVHQVLVPVIRPHYTVKEIKTDPVVIESSWKSHNNRYLNFRLNLLSGTVEGMDNRHLVGMMCDTLLTHADGRQHLHLRLFHNQNGVPEYYGYQAYLSIPLKTNPYRLHTGDTVSVRINTYDGEVLKTFVY